MEYCRWCAEKKSKEDGYVYSYCAIATAYNDGQCSTCSRGRSKLFAKTNWKTSGEHRGIEKEEKDED